MATYCIGDLHGRYDLFCALLQRICFNSAQDQLYLLGDVIDWNYGGIKIIDHMMNNIGSCTLILGNHEQHFLYMEAAYDTVMFDPEIKKAMIAAVDVYSEKLFDSISNSFEKKFASKNPKAFYANPAIKKWLKGGNFLVRSKLLNTMVNLAEHCNFDKDVYQHIKWILLNLSGRFKTKKFVYELLEQTSEHYISIKNYLKSCPNSVDLHFGNRSFHLTHWKGSINPAAARFELPNALTSNVTYIFGHDPVPLLHRKFQNTYNSFDFSYRNIFSWLDTHGNRYYNLDLASNPVVALKLDDMSEYYVGLPTNRKNAIRWDVPIDNLAPPCTDYQYVSYAQIGKFTFKNAAIITKKNCSLEFLIGISNHSKTIHYARISWLEFRHEFTITNWLDNQSIDEIIEKVRSDFEIQRYSFNCKTIEKWLQGINVDSDNSPQN